MAATLTEMGARVDEYPHEIVGNRLFGKVEHRGVWRTPALLSTQRYCLACWHFGGASHLVYWMASITHLGAVDMKGGITIALSAIRGLQDLGRLPERPDLVVDDY